MSLFLLKPPYVLKHFLYPSLHWNFPVNNGEKVLYITFDDGPSPGITENVLEILDSFEAKATFFCVGEKARNHLDFLNIITEKGHSIGNHTYNHLNGWKNAKQDYIENIMQAKEVICSNLFRPPYGKITHGQINQLKNQFHIIMWSILSGDFDKTISPEKCYQNIRNAAKSGDIVVFHDSIKAEKNMIFALPRFLEEYKNKGYSFQPITPSLFL